MLHTYPFILTTDTTHYIHVENLVTTLLSSRPRRLLTMKDDHSFTESFSEASECSAEDFGDKVPPVVVDHRSSTAAKKTASLQHTHWTLSGTHLVSRQLVALIGPHLHQCVLNTGSTSSSPINGDSLEGGEALQECIQQWASHPLFWKNGYCGRLAALRYDASALSSPGSYSSYPLSASLSSSQGSTPSSTLRSTYETFRRNDRRGLLPLSPSPENFEAFYRMKQRERAQVQGRRSGSFDEEEDDSMHRDDEDDDSAMDVNIADQNTLSSDERNGNTVVRATTSSENKAGSTTHWIVGSGLTQPEDFTLLYQTLIDREADAQPDSNEVDDE